MSTKGSKFYQNCLEFVTEMSAEDVEMFESLCGSCETSIKEVLTQFVNDLIRNDHSSGSDERMYIGKWFTRCFLG